ncbi:MAG: class B sortase [Firmicutes bacterium]|nr:class B sortase [Bacillota bacterium]
MKESFDNKNQEYISKWIESNPNFSNIKFQNNSILFSNGSKIDLKNFSLSSLLDNEDFISNLKLMDEYLLYKIIYANAEIYKFYNRDTNIDEYIKDIKITDQGNVLITTDKSKKETKGIKINSILMTYSSLLNSSTNGKVSIDKLFKKIGLNNFHEKNGELLFFDLLDKNDEFKTIEIHYIGDFSKYMYTLVRYQNYLVGDAKKLLESCNYKINKLMKSDNLNNLQKDALKLYNKYTKYNKIHDLKKRIHRNKTMFIIAMLIFTLMIIYNGLYVLLWSHDNRNIDKQVNQIYVNTKVTETMENENTEIINNNADKSDPYWDYIKMNLINVDFSELKKTNNDTVGWIQVNGTNINYPFVQTTDNEYYLTHQFDKKFNGGGWVWLDYRNNSKEFDKNSIIYAHGRQNKTMFGSLRNILTNDWINNKENYVIKLSTETENTLWQVFSVYRIPTTSDYLEISFEDNNKFLEFANMLKNRSQYDFGTNVSDDDKILTLSTCYNNADKVVLHAKLIKKESR